MDFILNKSAETMKRADIEKLQLERLKHIVKYCYENVPFYTKKMDEAGVKPEMIKTLEDIKLIPLTTKEDLRDNYPFGMFAVPQNKIVRIHASSGTTGNPTVVGYTKNDLDVWSEDVARLVYAVGANSDSIVQICFGYGLFTGALGLHYGLEKVGASVIPSSSGNTEKQLKLMRDFGTNTLVSTPSYALYLAEKSKELGFSLDEYKIRLGLLGSEGTTPEMRDQIEAAWGMFVTDNYGLSEIGGPGMSGECMERDGLHINEDHFLCEIINSQTHEVLGEGETGEMVVTTLTKEGMPLLRYRTKDISRITYEPCRCGRTTARMDKIKGRSDDMLKIRGVNVFPSQVESVLIGLDDIAPHYQLIVRREGFQDTLEVKVELLENVPLEKFSALEKIQRTVESKLQTVLGIKAKVTLAEPKSLERFQGKAKRILDLRNQ